MNPYIIRCHTKYGPAWWSQFGSTSDDMNDCETFKTYAIAIAASKSIPTPTEIVVLRKRQAKQVAFNRIQRSRKRLRHVSRQLNKWMDENVWSHVY